MPHQQPGTVHGGVRVERVEFDRALGRLQRCTIVVRHFQRRGVRHPDLAVVGRECECAIGQAHGLGLQLFRLFRREIVHLVVQQFGARDQRQHVVRLPGQTHRESRDQILQTLAVGVAGSVQRHVGGCAQIRRVAIRRPLLLRAACLVAQQFQAHRRRQPRCRNAVCPVRRVLRQRELIRPDRRARLPVDQLRHHVQAVGAALQRSGQHVPDIEFARDITQVGALDGLDLGDREEASASQPRQPIAQLGGERQRELRVLHIAWDRAERHRGDGKAWRREVALRPPDRRAGRSEPDDQQTGDCAAQAGIAAPAARPGLEAVPAGQWLQRHPVDTDRPRDVLDPLLAGIDEVDSKVLARLLPH